MKKKGANKKKKRSTNIGVIAMVIIVIIILTIISILTIIFRSNKTTCKSVSNQTAYGYKIENTYDIISKNGIVNKVKITETVISKKDEILKSFEKQYKEQYEYNKNAYGGFTYQIKNKKERLEVYVSIDYERMDLKKFIKDNEAMKKFVNEKNKFTLKGAKKLYKSTGAKCS